MDPEKQLEKNDHKQAISRDKDIAGLSTSSLNTLPELQSLPTFPLVSSPRQTIFFCKSYEYREYQLHIPPMIPTPPHAHFNSIAFSRSMIPMYPPFNFPYSYNPNYYGVPPLFHARNAGLFLPPYAHTNYLPRTRLVYRGMRYTPVYQPLLGRNNSAQNVLQELSKIKKKNATRHLCTHGKNMYATPSGINKHQLLHCPAGDCSRKSYTCKQCGEICESFATYKLHSYTHVALQMSPLL